MHQAAELVVGLRVAQGVARELPAVLVVVVPLREIVAVRERRQRAFEREDVQAVARQVEVADDLRPQQAHDIGKLGEPVAREDLLGDGRAANDVASLVDKKKLGKPEKERPGSSIFKRKKASTGSAASSKSSLSRAETPNPTPLSSLPLSAAAQQAGISLSS